MSMEEFADNGSPVWKCLITRDIANPESSQIYNWGIKKVPSLDGVGSGITRSSDDVSLDGKSPTLDGGKAGINADQTLVSSVGAEAAIAADNSIAESLKMSTPCTRAWVQRVHTTRLI